MLNNLRADFAAVRDASLQRGWVQKHAWSRNLRVLFHFSFPAVIVYRFGHWVEGFRVPVLRQFLWVVAAILRRMIAIYSGIFIMPKAEIGPGLIIHGWGGIFVGAVKMGSNCTLNPFVMVTNGARKIGDSVFFGAGCKTLGDIEIGSNVVIMPNSLVITDVPDNTTIVGVPARIKLRGGRPKFFRSALSKNPGGPHLFRGPVVEPTEKKLEGETTTESSVRPQVVV
jgi:serine O-acetyltransferase